MGKELLSKSSLERLTFNDDDEDDTYISAEVNLLDVAEDLITFDIFDIDRELAAGFYFSLPDIRLPDFDHQLTEPLCPPMSDHDFLSYYSLHPPSVSGLMLVPKHTPQIQISPQHEYVSLTQTQTKAPDFSFLNSLSLQTLQSCNGLFLCFSQQSETFYVCNPRTQHLEEFPSRSPTSKANYSSSLNLAFDPYASPYYKIISVEKLLHQQNKKPLHQISVYSSETRTWVITGKPFHAPADIDFTDAVFCNGAIHWMKRATKGLYFNLDEEVLREMPKPPLKEQYSLVSCEYFGESQGHLYYIIASPDLPFLELFEMKEDYSGWFLRGVIDLKALATEFPIMDRRSSNSLPHPYFSRYECDVLTIVQGSADDEELVVALSIPGEVIAYNVEKRYAKKLCDLRLRPDDRAVWYRVYSSYQVL